MIFITRENTFENTVYVILIKLFQPQRDNKVKYVPLDTAFHRN